MSGLDGWLGKDRISKCVVGVRRVKPSAYWRREDNARSIRDIVTFVGVYFEREHSPWGRNDGRCGRSPTCHRKASTQDSDNTSHITDRDKELFEGLNNSVGKQ